MGVLCTIKVQKPKIETSKYGEIAGFSDICKMNSLQVAG